MIFKLTVAYCKIRATVWLCSQRNAQAEPRSSGKVCRNVFPNMASVCLHPPPVTADTVPTCFTLPDTRTRTAFVRLVFYCHRQAERHVNVSAEEVESGWGRVEEGQVQPSHSPHHRPCTKQMAYHRCPDNSPDQNQHAKLSSKPMATGGHAKCCLQSQLARCPRPRCDQWHNGHTTLLPSGAAGSSGGRHAS